MRITDTYRLQQPQTLTGLFKSGKAIYQAQEVLTDFGYSKDASKVIELDGKWHEFKTHSKRAFNLIRSRFLVGMLAGAAIALVGGFLSQTGLYPTLSFFEGTLLVATWIVLAFIGALTCVFIGALLMIISYSLVAEEYEDFQANEKEGVLITVAVRTPIDAKDIAREWQEIGGKMV